MLILFGSKKLVIGWGPYPILSVLYLDVFKQYDLSIVFLGTNLPFFITSTENRLESKEDNKKRSRFLQVEGRYRTDLDKIKKDSEMKDSKRVKP